MIISDKLSYTSGEAGADGKLPVQASDVAVPAEENWLTESDTRKQALQEQRKEEIAKKIWIRNFVFMDATVKSTPRRKGALIELILAADNT